MKELKPVVQAALLLAASLMITSPASAAGGSDADRDGVQDGADNCPLNPNGHQEDTGGDPDGDVCDRSTINPIFEPTLKGKSPDDFHASTPFQRTRVDASGIIEFSPEAGMFTPSNAAIGLDGDDSRVIRLAPQAGISGLVKDFDLNRNPGFRQSTWQSVVSELYEAKGRTPIRLHAASSANSVRLVFELALADVAVGEDVEIPLSLELSPNHCLDDGEAEGGPGRLTITDCASTVRALVSVLGLAALGRETKLEDTTEFFGLQRVTEELNAYPLTASVGDPDTVGSNFGGGVEASCDPATETVAPGEPCTLVESSYTFMENQSDTGLGQTRVTQLDGSTYTLGLVANKDFIQRNRQTSSILVLSISLNSATRVDIGSGQTVYGRHVVHFSEEADFNGHDAKIVFENVDGTFDGAPVDYDLLVNNGGTARVYDGAGQSQVALSFAGSKVKCTGSCEIHFNGGGAGVFVGSGTRVGQDHPCLASDPIDFETGTGRCALGRGKRASFVADKLLVRNSMSGVVGSEADILLEDYTFFAGTDPNVDNVTLLHGVVGLGCRADSGVRISVNPAKGDVVANVPLDPAGCTAAEIGEGTCQPVVLSDDGDTGACRLVARNVTMHGIASNNNPEGTDLLRPAGIGVACSAKYGTCEIGPKSGVNGRCEALGGGDLGVSWIEGFNVGLAASGPANVDAATGEPLTADDPSAVKPSKVCFDRLVAEDNDVAMVFGSNLDAEVSRTSGGTTQFGTIHLANGGANIATVANTAAAGHPCPTLDGVTCQTTAQKYACPLCKQGAKSFRAVSSGGLSAPTKLTIKQSNIGLDLATGAPASGMNPALPLLDVDGDLQAVKDPDTLTIAGRVASLPRAPCVISRGGDNLLDSGLTTIVVTASNIGAAPTVSQAVEAVSFAFDNTNSPNAGQSGVSVENLCYAKGGGACVTGKPVMASAESDQEVIALNAVAESEASPLEKPAGGDVGAPFKCYSSQPVGEPETQGQLAVVDLFTGEQTSVEVLRTLHVCDPVNKEREGVPDALSNLHCFEIRGDDTTDFSATVSTPLATHTLTAVNARTLCVPSVTSPSASLSDAEQALSHFQCYLRETDPSAPEKVVLLEDDYEDKLTRVKVEPYMVCDAVATNPAVPGGLEDADEHLACYLISDQQGEPAFPGAIAHVADRFEPSGRDVELTRAALLCERAKMALSP